MATRRQKVEVGVFLAVAVAILVAVLGALIGLNRSQTVTYYLEFQENVAGLSEGSKVTYQGVPVGRITDLVITPDNHVRVTIGVEPRKIQLRKDVRAKLTLESVFGPVAIDLSYPGDKHQPLLEPGALIPVESSLREHIENDIPRTLDKLAIVMARIDNTLAAVEPKRVAETVDGLNSAVKQLDATLARIKPEDVESVVRDFDKLLRSTDTALAELRAQTRGLTTTLQEAVKQGSADVAKTSARIGASLDELQKATQETTQLVKSVHTIVEKNRESVTASLTHARSVLEKADKQLDGMDWPATEKAFRGAATDVGDAARTIAGSRDDLRQSFENVERSLTRTLDELERTLHAARRLIDLLERDPSAILRGKAAPQRK